MNDLYLKLVNTQLGQQLTQTLNLPKPVELIRSPADVLSTPTGSVLIASSKHNFALQNIFKIVENDNCSLFLARISNSIFSSTPAKYKTCTSELQLNNLHTTRFKHLIFDATGLSTSDDLKYLYLLFKHATRQISTNGRIIIIGQIPKLIADMEHASVQGALMGFCKSIAKEVGKKGVTCNVIYLEKGAQKALNSSLLFFMSPKSAYITGQSIDVINMPLKTAKINWKQPLKGKIAIVTGAAQGIGLETAKILARDGAKVVCLDIPSNLKAVKKLANSIDGHSLAIDLAEDDAVQKILDTIGAQLGVIDIIVHNAGITRDKTIAKMPEHFWDQVININLSKVIKINEGLLKNKAFSPKARIVCISSISGIAGNFGQSNYACSKAGISAYVKAMNRQISSEGFEGLTINAIAPGFIETKMTNSIPLLTREAGRRMNSLSQGGLPLDIAEGVSFFCHPASQALSGNLLRICGQSLLGK